MDSNLTNIEQYYKEVDSDIDFEEFKLICLSPFKFLKSAIGSNKLKDIRLKYLGVFKVAHRRINFFLRDLERRKKLGQISEKYYTNKKQLLNSYESKS